MNKKWLFTSLILFALAILLGAFGAHGLKSLVNSSDLTVFEVAVRYQFYAAFFLMGYSWIESSESLNKSLVPAFFFLGWFLFSGSLYGIVACHALGLNAAFLGPITPLGGVLMVFSVLWLVVVLGKLRQK
jgi:uncharacterized membrane protein YgdD (TMEM256/DUF423 family)